LPSSEDMFENPLGLWRRRGRAALLSACLVGSALLAVTACSDFTPATGALQPSCTDSDATTSVTTSGPYGVSSTTVTGPCPDAGTGVNALEAGLMLGSVLVADQLNNRVIVLDSHGTIVWNFGSVTSPLGKNAIVAPNDAELYYSSEGIEEVLIADTGLTMGGVDPTCPDGCPGHRVIIVDYKSGMIEWTYDGLSGPTSARMLSTPDGDEVLISDQGNNRVIQVNRASMRATLVYGGSPDAGSPFRPQSAERLPNGHTLIADQGGNVVIEVAAAGEQPVWQYPTPPNPAALNVPAFASRLADGKTLIADTNNNRVLAVDMEHDILWSYIAMVPAAPTGVVGLANGDKLITLSLLDLVIEVSGANNTKVYRHGGGSPGTVGNELNQPYNAKIVCDYTGLTQPPMPCLHQGDL
jgi:hypothetical protein